MFPSAQPEVDRVSPSDRFTTTYQQAFKPIKVHQPLIRTRTRAGPAPVLSSSLQDWSTSIQCTYKTTNSTYGSVVISQEKHEFTHSKIHPVPPHSPHAPNSVSQHPSGSFPPSFLHPVDILTPSVLSEDQKFGSTLKEDAGQEAGVARETGHSLGEDAEDRRCFICAKNGMIRLEEFLSLFHKESKPQQKLRHPASWPSFTRSRNRDAGNWESSSWGLKPILDLQSRTFPQSSSRRCFYCAWEDQHRRCTEMQQVRLPDPPLTEYQASFGAQWIQPKIHQTDLPPYHRKFHPFNL